MLLVLSFFVCIIIFIAFGIYLGDIKITIKKLEFIMNGKIKVKNNYKIGINIFLFRKIKFLGLNLENGFVRIFGKKISYEKIKNSKFYKDSLKKDITEFDKKLIKDNLKNLNMSFENLNLDLKFGSDSILITSFLTFIFSTVISFIIQQGVEEYNPKKHKFIITPIYENRNTISIFLELIASFKLKNIIKVASNLNNLSKMEHIKNKISLKEIKI